MAEENISQEFRLKNIDETSKYFLEEIRQNKLVSKKCKKVCTTVNHIEHILILASAITGCVSISAFVSLIGISIGITSSAIGLKMYAIIAGISKYKSIIRKMKEIFNKFLLPGDKFMPKMHLRQPGFTYSACGPFTKSRERIQKLKETGDSRYIYQNELDKACLQHDTAYGDFKDLTERTAFDKIVHYKAFDIAKNPKYDGYQGALTSLVYKFLIKIILVVV